jgi:tetratricopeptide (TPR) repeat protein
MLNLFATNQLPSMKSFRLCLILLLALPTLLSAQLFKDSREMFLEAESYFLFEEYNEALPLYLTLHRENPENDYINYKIGVCYLNTPGQKDKSILFLENAKENIDWKMRRETYRTMQAPADVLFYLAQAYHVNYQFEDAIKYFERFKIEANPKVYNLDLIDTFITASHNAMETVESPLFFLKTNLDEPINSRLAEFNPVVSGNEEVMIFSRKLPFYDGMFFSRNVDGEWTEPWDITPMIGSDGDTYPVSLSYDGTELYIYKLDNYIGNIYTSNYVNGEWTKMVKLNENINTKYWESHASISKDGQKLYFTSNRPGGFGGLDIYVSERIPNGDWGPAKNLGKPINTELNEESPFITEDGNTLYYSSYGYYNIGGYDIFYSSRLDDGTWSVPLNAGYPISTPDDDLFFNPLKDGRYAYIARSNPERVNGVTDIYRLEIFSDTHPRKFQITGTMTLAENVKVTPSSRISVVKADTGDTLFTAVPDSITGEFAFELDHGEYKLIFSEEGFEQEEVLLNLPINNPDSEVSVFAMLEPSPPVFQFAETPVYPWWTDTVEVSRQLGITNHQIRVSTGDPVEINMNLEKDTKLRIETWTDDRLVKVDTFEIDTRQFTYRVNPLPGKTELKVYYLDKNNELIRDELSIAYVPEIEPEIPAVTVLSPKLQAFYKELINVSGEDLRTVLLSIDFNKENIGTPEDLVNYLVIQSEFNNYTASDVRLALLAVASKNKTDVSSFLATLIMKSKDPLYSMLREIDLEKEGITTIPQLIEVIERKTGRSLAEDQALVALATQLALEETTREQQELAILYYELMKLSGENIRKALQSIEPEKSGIRTTRDLIRMLSEKKGEYGYTDKDLERLLLTIIDSKSNDISDLRKKWAGLSVPALGTLINTIQVSGPVPPAFSTYASGVTANAGRSGVTQQQVIESLSALAISETIQSRREMAILYFNMLRLADGKLKVALEQLDLDKEQISTSQELIDFLITEFDTLGYSQQDVMVLMARISAEKDLEGFFAELSNLSSGNLQKLLKSIDLKRDNIQTVDELIALLIEKAPEYGYSPEDILSVVGQLSIARSMGNQMDMLLLRQNLAALGKMEMRMAIESIDTSDVRLITPEQLIDYLINISDSAGFSSEDVWDVVFDLGTEGQKDVQELISSLKNIANERILKALLEIEKNKIPVQSIKELMDYLIEKGKEFGYTEADVRNLLLQQAIDNQKLLREKPEEKPRGMKGRYWLYLILLLVAVILSWRYLRKAKKQ